MRLHELTERGRGVHGAYELKKRKTDVEFDNRDEN